MNDCHNLARIRFCDLRGRFAWFSYEQIFKHEVAAQWADLMSSCYIKLSNCDFVLLRCNSTATGFGFLSHSNFSGIASSKPKRYFTRTLASLRWHLYLCMQYHAIFVNNCWPPLPCGDISSLVKRQQCDYARRYFSTPWIVLPLGWCDKNLVKPLHPSRKAMEERLPASKSKDQVRGWPFGNLSSIFVILPYSRSVETQKTASLSSWWKSSRGNPTISRQHETVVTEASLCSSRKILFLRLSILFANWLAQSLIAASICRWKKFVSENSQSLVRCLDGRSVLVLPWLVLSTSVGSEIVLITCRKITHLLVFCLLFSPQLWSLYKKQLKHISWICLKTRKSSYLPFFGGAA